LTDSPQWWREQYPTEPDAWKFYEDFRAFLCLVWAHLNLPPPTPIQLDIARSLQYGDRRDIVCAFRGVGKSWVTSAFVCWLLLRDPQLNILVVSASKDRADNFTTFTLRLITEMPMLQHLTPRADQRCSKVAFDVAPAEADHSPSMKSVGISGQLAGSRADVIIGDDVEVPNNSATQALRDKLGEAVKEFDAILKPNGRVLYLGTPQTEFSLYKELLNRGYRMRIWPARYPNPELRKRYGDLLAPYIAAKIDADETLVGKTTDPKRFSDFDLMERELSYGKAGFALQFMLDTSLSDVDRYPLKLADLIVHDLDFDRAPEKLIWSGAPEHALKDVPCVGFNGDQYHRPMDYARDEMGNIRTHAYQGCVMFIDPSGRGKDETGVAVSKMLNSCVFVPFVAGFRDGYSEKTLTAIAETAKKYKVSVIRIEENFGDGMFGALLKPYLQKIYPCTIEDYHSVGQKELRIIDTLEPVMNQHRLVIDKKMIDADYRSVDSLAAEQKLGYQLFYQLTRITRDRGALRHDDRLEALSGAVGYWVEQMSKLQDEAIDEHHEAALKAELERFMEHAIGYQPAPDTWA
jgi:hypothetical protein